LSQIEKAWEDSFKEGGVWFTVPGFGSIRRAAKRDLVRLLRKQLEQAENPLVLEAGCGSAVHSFGLAYKDLPTVALDYSFEVVKSVESSKRRFSGQLNTSLILSMRGNIKALGLADNSFDAVFNDGAVEHFMPRQERIDIYRELLRVLKPGGSLIANIPNDKHPLWPVWCWYARRYCPEFLEFLKGGKLAKDDISPQQLGTELQEAGAQQVRVVGLDPYQSIRRLPANFFPLRAFSVACETLLPPPPAKLKLKLGYSFAAYGKKTGT